MTPPSTMAAASFHTIALEGQDLRAADKREMVEELAADIAGERQTSLG